jgi:thioredoxin-related protein
MEDEVYPNLSSQLSDNFITTRINRDDHESTLKYKEQKLTPFQLAQKLKAESVPAIIFLSPNGDYLLQLSGFFNAESLYPVLKYLSSNAYKRQTLEAFLKKQEEKL